MQIDDGNNGNNGNNDRGDGRGHVGGGSAGEARGDPPGTPRSGGGPLAGIVVLDLSNFVFGPLATQWLADMGADVIKVEPPEGDPTRGVGRARHPGMGSLFLNLNRNKRSVVLDLKQSWDREALDRLLQRADVLVHNMRPAAERKLGLDYPSLAGRFPRLVHAAALGFGSGGPYSDRPAYDDVIQGLSGLAGLQGQVSGAPAYVPMLMADKLCGIVLSNAITTALYARQRSGRGQSVQVPMLETMAAFVMYDHLADAAFEPSPDHPQAFSPGYARALSPWHRPLPTLDGHVCVVANTDAQWRRLFEAIGRPECAADPRFASIGDRMRHLDALYALVEDALRAQPTAHWLSVLEAADLPASAASSLAQVRDDPHLKATGFFQRIEHPTEGTLLTTDVPTRWSDTPASIRCAAPRLGEHTASVLRWAGYGETDLERAAAGIDRPSQGG